MIRLLIYHPCVIAWGTQSFVDLGRSTVGIRKVVDAGGHRRWPSKGRKRKAETASRLFPKEKEITRGKTKVDARRTDSRNLTRNGKVGGGRKSLRAVCC